jgi:hypothetical protein
MKSPWGSAVRVILVVLAALLLWSARYRYDHIIVQGDTYLVRVHRVTGHADILIPEQGWVPAEESWNDAQDENPDSRT